MDTKKVLYSSREPKEPKLLGVYFNQDQTCFTTCSNEGFKVFSSYPMEIKLNPSLNGTQHYDTNHGIVIAKMLYKTNYIGLVGGGHRPRFPSNKLCIWDNATESNAIVLDFDTPIVNLHLSRVHIVVVLKNLVLVYSFKPIPELILSFETIDNKLGVSDFRVTKASSILVFPARLPGQLHIVDISNSYQLDDEETKIKSIALVKAHKNAIHCVTLSPCGNLVASASELGTLIRVHDTKTCSLIHEFRRGVESATITDMKFSPGGDKLAVLSDKSTLHIYYIFQNGKIEENQRHRFKNVPVLSKYFGSTWSFVSKSIGDKTDPSKNDGIIGWVDDSSWVVVWKFKGIWEKYNLVKKIISNSNKDMTKWSIQREGWKSIDS